MLILLVVKFFKVEFCNGNNWGSGNFHLQAVMFSQYWLVILICSHSCLHVNKSHHFIKCIITVLKDMVESLHVTVVHIKVYICWELCRLPKSCTPLIYSSIKLTIYVSTKLSCNPLHILLWPPMQPLQLGPHEPPPHHHPHMLGSVLFTGEQMNWHPLRRRGPVWLQWYGCYNKA